MLKQVMDASPYKVAAGRKVVDATVRGGAFGKLGLVRGSIWWYGPNCWQQLRREQHVTLVVEVFKGKRCAACLVLVCFILAAAEFVTRGAFGCCAD